MGVILPNTFVFWQMLATKVWQNFTKTARPRSRNLNIMLSLKERSREIVCWLENGFWLNIFFVSWKCFVFWAKGIVIAERGLPCVSIWSLRFTTSNSTQTDFCKRSNFQIGSVKTLKFPGVIVKFHPDLITHLLYIQKHQKLRYSYSSDFNGFYRQIARLEAINHTNFYSLHVTRLEFSRFYDRLIISHMRTRPCRDTLSKKV